jgi:hypothetical protein
MNRHHFRLELNLTPLHLPLPHAVLPPKHGYNTWAAPGLAFTTLVFFFFFFARFAYAWDLLRRGPSTLQTPEPSHARAPRWRRHSRTTRHFPAARHRILTPGGTVATDSSVYLPAACWGIRFSACKTARPDQADLPDRPSTHHRPDRSPARDWTDAAWQVSLCGTTGRQQPPSCASCNRLGTWQERQKSLVGHVRMETCCLFSACYPPLSHTLLPGRQGHPGTSACAGVAGVVATCSLPLPPPTPAGDMPEPTHSHRMRLVHLFPAPSAGPVLNNAGRCLWCMLFFPACITFRTTHTV